MSEDPIPHTPGGIGGFVGAERARRPSEPFHPGAVRVSSARAALARLLVEVQPQRVFVPDWICDTVLAPILSTRCAVERLAVGADLLPTTLPAPDPGELLLLVDPFALGHATIHACAHLGPRLVVDLTQALYRTPPHGCWGIASARKFLGVPDGAFVWGPTNLPRPTSVNERVGAEHLTARAAGASEALDLYRRNEAALSTEYLAPSALSDELLDRIDHTEVQRRRTANAAVLHTRLKVHNQLELPEHLPTDAVPMAYPFLPKQPVPHAALYAEQIWAPRLWPERCEDGQPFTRHLSRHLLPLPCDQRYSTAHMHHIADVVVRELTGSTGG